MQTRKAKRQGQELTLKKNERRPVRVGGEIVGYVVYLRPVRAGEGVRMLFQPRVK